ncbi:MAG: ATP-binding protein [Caldilineaceae bacterium]
MLTYLIAMKGHPATGKSTLAAALAQAWKWPLLDKDDIKDHTLGLPNENDLAYAILWQMVATQLRLGISVIVDSPFAYPTLYAQAQTLATNYPARLLVVETQLCETIWRQRLDARLPTESTHKIQGWDRMRAHLVAYNDCWRYPIDPAHHLLVNTEEPTAQLLEQVWKRISAEQ